ncbi:MAG: PEP-utilizing enzyme [bacterium]|nr:PEP-utilizing enzyme [bacterium]
MDIPKGIWVKNWVVNVGLVFDSLDGKLYSQVFEQKLGKKINISILTYEDGVSTNFFLEKDLNDYGHYLARQIIDDNLVATKWSDQLISETDRINALMIKLAPQENIDYNDFIELKGAFFDHVAVNFAIKRSIDYLPAGLLEKLLDDFERARLYTESVYMEFEQLVQKFLYVIAKEKDYSNKIINCLTYSELENYLQINHLPEKQILEERVSLTLLWYQNGECEIFTKEKAQKMLDQITKPESEDIIKGIIAYKGFAKGRVRIVNDPGEIRDFQTGDILVTGMTRPEFLPLMSKSAAFITDSGGLLSHASITAREMKKPCIVGTQIATQVLKDGDTVEVNANDGIVKIVK